MKAEMARRICHYHLRKRVGYGEESYASATAVVLTRSNCFY